MKRSSPERLLVLAIGLALSGCGSTPTAPPAPPEPKRTEVKDGAPPFRADIMTIPDAVPRPEPVTIAGNKSPYTVLGGTYRVSPVAAGWRQRGYGSWYGTKFHGQRTSNGEAYDVYAMTAAHKTLPIPSYVRVTNLENSRQVIVRVNDRGPFHDNRIIALSYAAAYRLGYADKGIAPVEIELLDPDAPEWVAQRDGKSPAHHTAATRSPDAAPEASSGSETWLQAGAFSSIDNARQLQRSLSTLLGREATIRSSTTDGGVVHRVRVGPLESMAAAREAQRRIAAASLGAARIVRGP